MPGKDIRFFGTDIPINFRVDDGDVRLDRVPRFTFKVKTNAGEFDTDKDGVVEDAPTATTTTAKAMTDQLRVAGEMVPRLPRKLPFADGPTKALIHFMKVLLQAPNSGTPGGGLLEAKREAADYLVLQVATAKCLTNTLTYFRRLSGLAADEQPVDASLTLLEASPLTFELTIVLASGDLAQAEFGI